MDAYRSSVPSHARQSSSKPQAQESEEDIVRKRATSSLNCNIDSLVLLACSACCWSFYWLWSSPYTTTPPYHTTHTLPSYILYLICDHHSQLPAPSSHSCTLPQHLQPRGILKFKRYPLWPSSSLGLFACRVLWTGDGRTRSETISSPLLGPIRDKLKVKVDPYNR